MLQCTSTGSAKRDMECSLIKWGTIRDGWRLMDMILEVLAEERRASLMSECPRVETGRCTP